MRKYIDRLRECPIADELKVACRRAERRKGKVNLKKEIENG
jgi:hypothetical protein